MHAARMLILLFTLTIVAGCAEGPPQRPLAGDGPKADSISAIHGAARATCAAAGLAERTGGFARCVAAFHAREAARARDAARAYMQRAAKRHGLCVDPVRFELARCIEI